MNNLYLHTDPRHEGVSIAIGSRHNKRSVYLTPHEAQQLAYRLMSLAAGGETYAVERFAAATPEDLP